MIMKRMLFAMLMLVALSLGARDRLYIENFDIAAGQTVQMPILLQNDTVYCAFQTDLVLPAGLEVELDGDEYVIDLTARKDRSHVISCNLLPDGAIRIFVTSMSVRPFIGNSGAVAIATVKATSTFSGTGTVQLRGSVAVEENGLKHHLADCTAYLNGAEPAVRGDVNGDEVVDVDDMNIVINIMVRKAAMADWPAADLDGNGVVDIDDLNHVINIMVHKE